MATFYPPSKPEGLVSSESKFWDAASGLSSEWHVLHSITWQSRRGGREADGEIDFLLVHPSYGAYVVEVKGGGIKLVDGRWYSVDRHGETHEIKNPFIQAKDSKYALLNYLRDKNREVAKVPIQHAVCFPDISVTSDISTYGSRNIIFDLADLESISASVDKLVDHWKSDWVFTKRNVLDLVSLLAPSFEVRTKLANSIKVIREKVVRLTNEQFDVLHSLSRNRLAVILGGAGTGKTLIAIEAARRLAANDFRTLLVAYNQPIADYMAKVIGDREGVYVSTYHKVAREAAKHLGQDVHATDSWLNEEAPIVVLDAVQAGSFLEFDAVVIDEGQDFSTEWVDSLMSLSKGQKDPITYVFADEHQDLYSRGLELQSWPTFVLTKNCRNSDPIAEAVAKVWRDHFAPRGVGGEQPTHVECSSQAQLISSAVNLASRLVDSDGVKQDELVLLSNDTRMVKAIRERSFSSGVFCDLGQTGLVAESIRRFKGLETDVVILLLTDDLLSEKDQIREMIYVGASRPRAHLFVLSSKEVWNRIKDSSY